MRAALAAEDLADLDMSGILDHDRQVAEYTHRRQIFTRALDRADADLAGNMQDYVDRIVTDHVRPTGEKLWAAITKAVTALDGVEV